MEISIINAQQTPKTSFIINPEKWCIDNKELIENLLAFAKRTTNAIGLASNQLAVDGARMLDRFCLIRDFEKETEESGPLWDLAINPEIILTKGVQDLRYEGCLTWPGMTIVAKRFRQITVKTIIRLPSTDKVFGNITYDYQIINITKFKSHVWQHEINHLDGIEEDVQAFLTQKQPKQVSTERNSLCLCGSGIKYKKCCGLYEIN